MEHGQKALIKLTDSQSSARQLKDRLIGLGVTLGGTMVLVALLLIFFYLLYVVKPIFNSATVEQTQRIDYVNQAATLALGIEEQNEIAYRITDNGKFNFYDVQNGQPISAVNLTNNNRLVSAASAMPNQQLYALAFDDGTVQLLKPKFDIQYTDGVRKTTPNVDYPFGEAPLELADGTEQVKHLGFAANEEKLTFAYRDEQQRFQLVRFNGEVNFISDEVEWSREVVTLSDVPMDIKKVLITPEQRRLIILSKQKLHIYNIEDEYDIELQQVLDVATKQNLAADVALLAGASSIIVANDDGLISQYFEVPTEAGRRFDLIRTFDAGFEVVSISMEFYRKSFSALGKNGEIALFYTTSESELFNQNLNLIGGHSAAFSPRSNSLLVDMGSHFAFLSVKNEHPEVSWSGIFQEVWYEGYPEPQYIWQSTSASEDFEAKLSLTPLVFGTIKAALYAMLFAVPLAISGAIYTAYFMSPGVRSFVKPTIEIMEALPTVILGFLAGLWLAPMIEESLPGVVLLLVLLPSSMLATAFAWHLLPQDWKLKLPESYREVLLIPVLMLVGLGAFELSPIIEDAFFGGNTRSYITNDLGITFDQRNSLVVGIAMGFAVIPTIFSIAEDAVFSVPKHLSNGSLALGATQWQTLTRVVLLTATPGIFSAVMMGFGRAVGETMIVLMATGNTPIMEWSFLEGMRTLAANIAVEMPESAIGSTHYRILFLAAFTLFIFTFLFNTVAEFVRQRLRERYSSL